MGPLPKNIKLHTGRGAYRQTSWFNFLNFPERWKQDKWSDLSKVTPLSVRAWTGAQFWLPSSMLIPTIFTLSHICFLPKSVQIASAGFAEMSMRNWLCKSNRQILNTGPVHLKVGKSNCWSIRQKQAVLLQRIPSSSSGQLRHPAQFNDTLWSPTETPLA